MPDPAWAHEKLTIRNILIKETKPGGGTQNGGAVFIETLAARKGADLGSFGGGAAASDGSGADKHAAPEPHLISEIR